MFLINRESVIRWIKEECNPYGKPTIDFETGKRVINHLEQIPYVSIEPLTDKEQRIFLAAMGREEAICKEVDAKYGDCREPYEDTLVSICNKIIRKVKRSLW